MTINKGGDGGVEENHHNDCRVAGCKEDFHLWFKPSMLYNRYKHFIFLFPIRRELGSSAKKIINFRKQK